MSIVSASSLARHCGHPRVLSKLPPKDAAERKRAASRDASAAIGTEFHRAADAWVKAGSGLPESSNPECQGWLDGLATMFSPHGREVETELAWGLTLDGEYCDVDEPEPHVYVPSQLFVGHDKPLPPLLTAGRCDASWEDDGIVWTVDWKTGRHPPAAPRINLQVNAAGMAMASRTGARGYVPGIFMARDAFFDWGEPVILGSPEHLAMFKEVEAAALLDETPRPGNHCESCWERRRCDHAQER